MSKLKVFKGKVVYSSNDIITHTQGYVTTNFYGQVSGKVRTTHVRLETIKVKNDKGEVKDFKYSAQPFCIKDDEVTVVFTPSRTVYIENNTQDQYIDYISLPFFKAFFIFLWWIGILAASVAAGMTAYHTFSWDWPFISMSMQDSDWGSVIITMPHFLSHTVLPWLGVWILYKIGSKLRHKWRRQIKDEIESLL